ncbi:MAG: Ppx/GppA family phosphatase [Bdellovibrionaceae bacterium]|nr:Ppx/GppA family phosphatase [Pseudobdellovibrionaceae bacterium]
MKVAALDLGSNSFLCLIVEGDKSGIKTVISDQVKVVRLGQGVGQSGVFHPDALARARQCLTEFKKTIDDHKVDRILAMATSAARDARNGSELFKIGSDLGIPIEIIPGTDEARITFGGATEGELHGDENILVIDVGGGSTEIIIGDKRDIHFSKSIDIGAVRLTERFISAQPISQSERIAAENYIDQKIASIRPSVMKHKIENILSVAGTPSALAAAMLGKFDPKKVQGFVLTQSQLKDWCDLFANTSVQEKIDKHHIESGRADVIFIGTTILHRFLVQTNQQSMKVSIKGVRYGVALEALSRG